MVCVAAPSPAKKVLANPEGLFHEHSDFFHTRRGAFGPRSVQRALGAEARRLLTSHATHAASRLRAEIDEELGVISHWPDAGNHLLHRHFRDVLLHPDRRPRLGPWVDAIVHRGVLAGARQRHGRLSRFLFRHRTFRRLSREVEARVEERAAGRLGPPRDLFDVLAASAGPGVSTRDLGELYLPFLFAVVGSLGFVLAWSVYLLGTHPPTSALSRCVVREALRLWPVAWQLLRHPARSHEILGCSVTPRDAVLISPYVTHRHPKHWDEPDRFRPERWTGRSGHPAFFPFGWGPHTCAAAALSIEVVERILDELRSGYRWRFHSLSDRPFIGPSLAPPRFRLDLTSISATGTSPGAA